MSALDYFENEVDEQGLFAMKKMHACNLLIFVATAPPTFTAHPSSVMVNVERNSMDVTLACEVDGATSYEWERQDGTIPSSATGVNTDTLTLVDLQQCDTGNYRCVASNDDNLSTPSKYAKITITGLLAF